MASARAFHKKGNTVINGVHYIDGIGCHRFPNCFACPFDVGCIYKNTTSSERRGWPGKFPPCMKIEYCGECIPRNCIERAGGVQWQITLPQLQLR